MGTETMIRFPEIIMWNGKDVLDLQSKMVYNISNIWVNRVLAGLSTYPLTYNGSGSLVSDAGRGIARIYYDLLNNPVRIQFTNGSVTRYVYSTAGEKLRVTHLTAVPNITVAIGSARELAPSEILSADSTDYLPTMTRTISAASAR